MRRTKALARGNKPGSTAVVLLLACCILAVGCQDIAQPWRIVVQMPLAGCYGPEITSVERQAVEDALSEWTDALQLSEPPIAFASDQPAQTCDVLFTARPEGKRAGIRVHLAQTSQSKKGQVTVNIDRDMMDVWVTHLQSNYASQILEVMRHELGHVFGLDHKDSVDPTDIMSPARQQPRIITNHLLQIVADMHGLDLQ